MLRHLLAPTARQGSRSFYGTSIAPPKLSLLRAPRSADIDFSRSTFCTSEAEFPGLPKKKEDYTIEEWIIAYYGTAPKTTEASSIASVKKNCTFEQWIQLYYSSAPVHEVSTATSFSDKRNREVDERNSKSTESSGSDRIIGFGLVSLFWLTSVGIAVLMDRYISHRKGSSSGSEATIPYIVAKPQDVSTDPKEPLTIVETYSKGGKTYSISNIFTAQLPHLSKKSRALKKTRQTIEDVIKAEMEVRKIAEEEIATLNSLEKRIVPGNCKRNLTTFTMLRVLLVSTARMGSLAFHTNSTAPMLRVSRSVDIEHCRSAFSKIDAGTRPLKKKEDYTIEEWIIAYYDKVPQNTTETLSVASTKRNCTFEQWIRLYYNSVPVNEIFAAASSSPNGEVGERSSKTTEGSGSFPINGALLASLLWLTSLGIVVFMERYLAQRKDLNTDTKNSVPSMSPENWFGHTSKAIINLPHGPLTIVEKHTTKGMTYSISNHFQARLPKPAEDDDYYEMFREELNSHAVTIAQSTFDSNVWDISYTVTRPSIVEAIEAEKELMDKVVVQIMTQHFLEKGIVEGVKLLVKARNDFRNI